MALSKGKTGGTTHLVLSPRLKKKWKKKLEKEEKRWASMNGPVIISKKEEND